LKLQADLNEQLQAKKAKSSDKKALTDTSAEKTASKKRPRETGEKVFLFA
jgi:hypothetical protein